MSVVRYRAGILGTLLLGGVFPLVGSLLAYRLLPQWRWPNVELHSAVEAGGAFAGLTLAALLLVRRHYRTDFAPYLWTACALLSMGALDALHACVRHGQAFVWLRSTATLAGGLLFALVWLPVRASGLRAAGLLPLLVLAGSLLFGVLSLAFSGSLPAMIRDDTFTLTAHALNAVGGLGATVAAVYFLQRASRGGGPDELLFATFCLLFGGAGLLFLYSRPWGADWWWWHFLRLAGYLIVLGYTFVCFARTERELKAINASLEQRVAERSAAAESRAAQLALSEEALRLSEEHTRSVVDHALDGLITIDARGLVTSFNPAAELLFGYPAPEVVGRNVKLLMPETYHAAHEAGLARFLRTGQTRVIGTTVELAGRRQDGSTFPLELAISTFRLGERSYFTGIIRDITERKRAEEELRRATEAAEAASRAKSEFLANMSHEIRTPMNAILGMTGLALDTSLTREQREYLTMVKGSAEALLGVINDILDFSKIEARKLELECLDFSLRDAVGDTLSALALRSREKGLELAGRVHPDVPDALAGDPGRLRQILLNLIGNALKFTEHGEVVVGVALESVQTPGEQGSKGAGEREAQEIVLSTSPLLPAPCSPAADQIGLHFTVRDTGIGIPADKREKVFAAFAQADSSTTRRYGGTGLGLAISAQLVQMMGGRIWVESTVGQGSTFHFTVSLRPASAPVAARPAPPAGTLRGLRVLVVDDNATNRLILTEMLGSWGMKPMAAEGAREALSALVAAATVGEPFALVLLDAMMPQIDGFQLAAAIRQDPQLHRLVLLMLSSSSGRIDDAQRCRELGIAACLTKPVRESGLLAAILTALQVAPMHEPAAPAVPVVPPPASRLRVLLAEDNPVNQRLAVRLLEKQGHAVVVVGDGRQALAALEADTFDVVLMDVQMPEMDGLAATTTLRQREQASGAHIPVLAMTAYAMKGDRERCLEAGMDGYLSKPIQPSELWQALAEIAARSAPLDPIRTSPVGGQGVHPGAQRPKELRRPERL